MRMASLSKPRPGSTSTRTASPRKKDLAGRYLDLNITAHNLGPIPGSEPSHDSCTAAAPFLLQLDAAEQMQTDGAQVAIGGGA